MRAKRSGAGVIQRLCAGDVSAIDASGIPDMGIVLGGFLRQGFNLARYRELDDGRSNTCRKSRLIGRFFACN